MKKRMIHFVIIILIMVIIFPVFFTTIQLAHEEIKENAVTEEITSTTEENTTDNDKNIEKEKEEEEKEESTEIEIEKENSEDEKLEKEEEKLEAEDDFKDIIEEPLTKNTEISGTQEIKEGIYELYTYVNATKVIDVVGSSKNNVANVDIYERGNQDNQKFQVKLNKDGSYTFEAIHSKKVLDVYGGGKTNGTNVCQYQSHGGDGQKWYLKSCGDGYYNLVSKLNGLYLDVTAGIGEDGTNIEVWQGNGGKAQKFKLAKVLETTGKRTIPNGIYQIYSKVSENRLLEVPKLATNNEVEIKIGSNQNLASQKFQVTYQNDGTYTIVALHSGKALDVKYGSGRNGTPLQQYSKHGQNSQKWVIVENADKTYSIISKCNGLALDIEAGSTKLGAKVQTYCYHGQKSQKFTFEICGEEIGTQTVEDGTYRILSNENNKKAWRMEGTSIGSGAKLQIGDNSKSFEQKFNIVYVGEGYYKIQSKNSNQVLTVESENPKVGSYIKQQEDSNLETQKWILKKYSESVYGIISKCGNLYITLLNGQDLRLNRGTDLSSQKFIFINENPKVGITTKIEDGIYQIVTKGNRVIDVTGGSYQDGSNVLIWDNTKVQQQKYQITQIKNTNYYKIIAVHSAKSFDVEGGNINLGANVIQYKDSGTNNQQWLLKDCGDGYYHIISKESGLYLDVTAGQISTPGANVELWYNNGADAQKFELLPISIINNDSYQISSKVAPYKFFDIEASSQSNNANLQIWSKNKENNQIFRVENIDNTYCKIIARHSNKILTVTENNNVVQADDANTDNQKWCFEIVGNGTYKVKSKATGYYLHIKGNNVQVENGRHIDNQIFQLHTLPQKHGIDVSQYNGLINWEYVKRSGVEFAIIRVGYRGYRTGAFAEDPYFRRNMEGAKRAGIKIGVYFFTQAVNAEEAREEANWTINKIREIGYANKIDYPIVIDTEASGGNPPGRADGLSVSERTTVCKTFCETIKSYGYRPMIYASRDWFYNNLEMSQLNQYNIWVAHYTGTPDKVTNYKNHYEIWQYTSSGQVMGIPGRVDLNISYQAY